MTLVEMERDARQRLSLSMISARNCELSSPQGSLSLKWTFVTLDEPPLGATKVTEVKEII